MSKLAMFVMNNSSKVPRPTAKSINVGFFDVEVHPDVNEAEFLRLTGDHQSDYLIDPFEGQEYNYITLGAWLGDQGLALQWMAIAAHLKMVTLMTPQVMLPNVGAEVHNKMCGLGYITVRGVLE